MYQTNRTRNQGKPQLVLAAKLRAAGFRKSDTQLALEGIHNTLRLNPELQKYQSSWNPFPRKQLERSL